MLPPSAIGHERIARWVAECLGVGEVALRHSLGGASNVGFEVDDALAARVLTERMPSGDGPPSLVHGDVGAGNFLTVDGEVSAMLDWELAHLGDPHEDLAWLWMRGAHSSLGDPFTRFAEYELASGTTIDHDRLAWHLALVMWKSVTAVHGRLRSAVPGDLAMYVLEARDELGRAVDATGTMVSRQVFTAYPSMFCWNALVDWSASGFRGWGEDQDCWHPRKWRQFVMEHRDRTRS